MMKIVTIIFIAFLLAGVQANEEEKTAKEDSVKKFGILPVPALGYTPETGMSFGVFSLFTFKFYPDSTTRTSSARLGIDFTMNKQVIFETSWIYFFDRERWFSRGLIHLSKYPDFYYGIGESTPDSNEVKYRSNRTVLEFELLKSIADKTFLGPFIRYENYGKIEYMEGNQASFTELRPSHIFGLGLTLIRDTRSNILTPQYGSYGELSVTANHLDKQWYNRVKLDLRKYITFSENTLSFRLLNESVSGNPTFYDYRLFGGDKNARGYYFGRFRDKNLLTLQGEYRSPLWWRFGLALFGGISKIYPSIDAISVSHLKPNYGFGLRVLTDTKENINLRLDYAMGIGGQDGFYVYFGESF
jgi:hypothetical protein